MPLTLSQSPLAHAIGLVAARRHIAPAMWRWAPVRAVRGGVVLDCHDGEPDNAVHAPSARTYSVDIMVPSVRWYEEPLGAE